MIISGCRCEDAEPVPALPDNDGSLDLNAFDHWSNDTTKKWVFTVNASTNSSLFYLYDDTLEFKKDTNIYPFPHVKYFKLYAFRKDPRQHKFVIGNYTNYTEKLNISLSGLNFELFDLYNMEDSGKYKSFIQTGKPIDDRYEVRYSSPYLKNRGTAIGTFTTIISTIQFDQDYANSGRESYYKQLEIAKNTGLVRYTFNYDLINVPNQRDTSYRLYYTIKEIIK